MNELSGIDPHETLSEQLMYYLKDGSLHVEKYEKLCIKKKFVSTGV